MLSEAGADIDYPSHEGLTALTLAIIKKNAELAEHLLREGANVNGLALRHPVANRCPHEDCPCGNWNFPPITPLQAASIRDMTEFARILLQAGADVNTPMYCQHKCRFFLESTFRFDSDDDNDGRVKFIHCFKFIGNALQIAAHRQNQELTEILLEAGANVNAAASKYDGRTALQAAVEKGDNRLIKCLLDAGADSNVAAAKYGKTALQAAVEKEDCTLVKCLLDAGANVNVQCSRFSGRTTLQAAVEKGNKYLVKYLLGAGANANAAASDYGGRTPLQVAAEKGDSDLIKWILDAGADINGLPGKYFGVTALTAAVKRGDLNLISLLLDAGADINHPSAASCGGSALGAAVMKNDINLIRFLLGNGADWADPDALLSAVVTKNFELMAMLLKARESIDRVENKSCAYNALQAAIEKGQSKFVDLLVAAGIDVNHPPSLCDKRSCWLPSGMRIESAVCAAVKNISMVRTLLEAGANPNIKGWDGTTPLQHAICMKNIPLMQTLLEAGANVNLPSRYWSKLPFDRRRSEFERHIEQTPIQAAALAGYLQAVEVFLTAGADVNGQCSGGWGVTALQGAAMDGYFEIARLLLEKNAEVDASASENGRTALEGAAENGRIDMVQLLLNAGAQIEGAGNVQYHRALDFAAKNGHYAVCKLLRSHRDSRHETPDATDI